MWSAGKGKRSCRVYTSVDERGRVHRNTNDPCVRLDYYKSRLQVSGVCKFTQDKITVTMCVKHIRDGCSEKFVANQFITLKREESARG